MADAPVCKGQVATGHLQVMVYPQMNQWASVPSNPARPRGREDGVRTELQGHSPKPNLWETVCICMGPQGTSKCMVLTEMVNGTGSGRKTTTRLTASSTITIQSI